MSIKDTLQKRQASKQGKINAREYISEKYQKKEADSFGLNTLENDLTNMGKTISDIYTNWQTPETMAQTKSSVKDLYGRLNSYLDYTKKYGGSEEAERLVTGYQGVLDDWDTLASRYGAYADKESYLDALTKQQELVTLAEEKGTEGWEKYLADMKTPKEKKTFLEQYAEATSGTYDTSPAAMMLNNVVQQKKNDDSYKKPTDEWTEEERKLFGAYYLTDKGKAYDYAVELNNAKALARKNEQMQKISESATSGVGTGIAHTVGSVLAAPMALADLLDDITDIAANRPIMEENIVTPFEYSQAVQGGIGEKLNTYGTLDEKIPVIGGRGWGDVYGLGTSVAQSMLSAYTLGELGTLASYFGQGAAAGIDDALSRGATDEQALLYGVILGAAEGASEYIGADELLKTGASSTLKDFMLNTLKRGGQEGLEEGFSSLIGEVADRIVMQNKSNYNTAVSQYMKDGLSEKEAKKKAIWDSIENVAYDVVSGFASGTAQGGIQTGKETILNRMEQNTQNPEEATDKFQIAENTVMNMPVQTEISKEADGQLEKIKAYAEIMEDKDAAELFVSQYDGKTDPDYYIDSFELAYGYGKNLIGSDSVIKNKGALTESQLLETYRAGVKSRGTAKIQEQLTEVTKKHFAENPVTRPGKFDISGVTMKNLTNRQKSAVEFARKLSEYAGVNITFFESKADENGVRTDANGWYDHATNTIHVDVYAGLTETVVEESIIPTLSHEMTHWMQDKAPQLYEQLTEQVMNALAAEQSVEELIAAEMGKKGLSYEVARDELVARACEDMLTNSRVLSSYLAGMDAKSATTLKDKIHEIAEKIKAWIQDLLKMYESGSREAKVLRKYEKKLNEVSATWDKAMMQAIRTNQATKEEVAPVQQNAALERKNSEREEHKDIEKVETRLKEQLQDWLKGTMPKDGYFELGVTSELYQKIGANGLPIIMEQDVVWKFTSDYNDHGIALDEVVKLPSQIANPVLLFEGSVPGSLVVLTELTDKKGREVIAALHLNKLHKRLKVNRVASVYGKDNVVKYVTTQIENGKMVYADKKRSEIWFTNRGLQLPKLVQTFISTSTDSISQSEENATGNIRFSSRETESVYDTVGEGERLKEENAKLREDVGNLKKKIAMEAESGSEISSTYLKKVAEQLLLKNKSNYDADSLAEQLKDVYEYVKENRDVKWGTLMSKTYEIATGILQEADSDVRVAEYGKKILDAMKQPVSLSPVQIEAAEGMYGEQYRKSLFGKLNVSRNGVPLSEMWKEWSTLYPDIFNAGVSEADQVAAVLEARRELTDATDVLEEYGQKELARKLAVEIYHQLWNMEPVKGLSEKYESEIRGLRKDHRRMMTEMRKDTVTHYETLLRNARLNRETEVRRVKQEARQKMSQHRENEQKQIKIRKITSNAMRMSRWLTENSAKNHISEGLKKPVTLLLDSIDFSSKQLLGLNKSKQGEMTKQDISFSEALEKVHTMAAGIRKAQDSGDGEVVGFDGMYVDLPMRYEEQLQEFSKRVNELMRRNGDNQHVLQKMTLEELETLDEIVQTLKTTIEQANKFLSDSRMGEINTAAQTAIREMDEMGENGQIGEDAKKFLYWHNALPIYAFKRFGSAGEALFRSFQRAQSTLAFNVRTIMNYTKEAYTAKEVNEWEKEIHEFEFSDGPGADGKDRKVKVRITTSQLMSLYCLSKREQAQEHLKGGGFKVEDFEDGARKVSQPEGLTMNKGRLYEMLSVLTERQKEVATRLQAFMNVQCSSWGNEISMRRFGYRAFTEENYFPIQSDENTLNSEAGAKNNELTRLLNMSFTKKLTPHANNRVVIRSVFDVFAEHSSDMAKYNAFALPVLDAYKWYNYQEKIKVRGENETGSEDVIPFDTKTVKGAMEKAYGEEAKKYFFQFMKDINGSYSAGIGEELAKNWMSKYKVAAVAANLRVVMLQPLSYIRALEVMDAKYLFSSNIFRKSKADKVMEYSGLAQWKDMGFYDINITRNVQSLIKHDESWKDKLVELTLKPAALADRFTWSKLWQACEAEIKDKRPELKFGSESFNQIVAERFEEIVIKTQVIDSVLTRSQLMRSKSVWTQSFTSFMSEPTVSYNLALEKHMDWNRTYRIAKESGKKKEDALKEAFNKHGLATARTIGVFILGAIGETMVGSLVNALRENDDEEEKLYERILTNAKKSIWENLNPLTKIPGVRDFFSVWEGYSIERMDADWMTSFVSAARRMKRDLLDGDGLEYKTVYNSLKAISQASGLPAGNLLREIVTIWNNTIGEVYHGLKIK